MDANILKAIADLAWPILAAIILLLLLPTIIRILKSRGVTIKYGRMELTVQDASNQMRKQIDDLQDQVRKLVTQSSSVGMDAENEMLRAQSTAESVRGKSVLWVDDKPSNNAHEISKLEDDGCEIMLALSTREALEFLDNGAEPNVIITDMGRKERGLYRRLAGLELLRTLKKRNNQIPVYVYSWGKATREHIKEIQELGGKTTSSPLQLFQLVEA